MLLPTAEQERDGGKWVSGGYCDGDGNGPESDMRGNQWVVRGWVRRRSAAGGEGHDRGNRDV